MVEDCTTPKGIRDYQEKKRAYLDKLRTARNDTLLVALADKLHNSRCIANDIENEGDKVWYRFNADPSLIVWYYRQVHAVLESRLGDENPAITLMLKKSRANTVYFGKLFWKE
jgi:(p)ppGpp synthase/HD superfamily hydrolase